MEFLMTHQDHLVNLELLKIARHTMGGFQNTVKQAFIPGGDMSGGGGGSPPGGDPSQGGGGAPPGGDPSQGGGGGQDPIAALQPMIQQMVQQAMQQQGGGMGGAGGAGGAASGAAMKPKIDVNVELMQMKNMLAKMCDHLGIQIPAQDMVATPDKLMAMSQGQGTASPPGSVGGGDPSQGGGGGAISPMGPMQGMQPAGVPGGGDPTKQGSYRGNGTAFDSVGLGDMGNRAAAIARIRKSRPE